MRKEKAEKLARGFLQAHYPNAIPDIHGVEMTTSSAYVYSVSGRINIGDLRPVWASFKVLVDVHSERVEDYEIVRERA